MTLAGRSPENLDLAEALRAQMAQVFGEAPEICGIRRLTGGTSHDSWAFDAVQAGRRQPFILRREFSGEQLDLSLSHEFELLRRLHTEGLSVPKPICAGDSGGALGSAFIVMERLSGGDIRKQMAADRLDPEEMGPRLVRLQASLHQADWRRISQGLWRVPEHAALQEVKRWERVASACAIGPDPLLCAAFDFLEAYAPVATPLTLVHGDFKANNIVVGADETIAVIDWELAHLGDPLEDLAWTMLWTTSHDLVGGMLCEKDYLAAYETAIGARIDRERLDYWRIFALAKLAAIFLKSMCLQGVDRHVRPTHLMLGRAMPWIQLQLADRLQKAVLREVSR